MTVVESVNGKTGVVNLPGLTSEVQLPTSVANDSGTAAYERFMATATGSAAFLDPQVPMSYFGADPTGVTDATKALNEALEASAAHGFKVVAHPGAKYKISEAGTKKLRNENEIKSGTYPYAVQIPSGANVDWQGAELIAATGTDQVLLLSNKESTLTTDVIVCKNVVINVNNRESTARGQVAVEFYGLAKGSELDNITVECCGSSVAGYIIACNQLKVGKLYAFHLKGQGWLIGGNTGFANTDCEFDLIHAEDVTSNGTFNEPGNGILIGSHRCSFTRLYSRNCAGGHKIAPGCKDLSIGTSIFDGTVNEGEANNNSENCGTKVQGDAPIAEGSATANGTETLTSVTETLENGTISTRSGSTAITASVITWENGQVITSTNLPFGTTVVSGGGTTSLVVSQKATATGSGTKAYRGWKVGQYISGPQIPEGTTVTEVGKSGEIKVSSSIPTGTPLAIRATDTPPPTRVQIGKVISRFCDGAGFLTIYSGEVGVDEIACYKNSRLGVINDVVAEYFDRLTIGRLVSEWSGFGGLLTRFGWINRIEIETLRIRNPGDVTTVNVNGIAPLGEGAASCHITRAEIIDDRSLPIGSQAVAATNENIFRIEHYTTNIGIDQRISSPKHWLGDPLKGNLEFAQAGALEPAAKALSFVVSNQNVRSIEYKNAKGEAGYSQPVIVIEPMNEAAQALGVPRYTVPALYELKFWFPKEATGTEVYRWRIIGIQWTKAKLAYDCHYA